MEGTLKTEARASLCMLLSVVGTQKVLGIQAGLQKARREQWMVGGRKGPLPGWMVGAREGPGGEDGRR